MILVVGGAGYIGAHTNKRLSQAGLETVVFDNLSLGHRDFVKWGHFFEGDLLDPNAIRACFKKYPIDTVMHFSALTNVGDSVKNPEKYYRNNVANTLNLLDIVREFEVKHFVFSSTAAIYGTPNTIPIPESHPQSPINPYGRSKLMIEQLLSDYDTAYGIKSVFLRYFNAAGADLDAEIGEKHDPESHLIPIAIQATLGQRGPLQLYGTDYDTKDGTCIRDYVHVTDIADAHLLAVQYLKSKNKSDAFNLGNGQGFSVREIVQTIEKVSGQKCPCQEAPRREGDPPVLVANSEKAKHDIGWRPELVDIALIIESAWKWHSQLLKGAD